MVNKHFRTRRQKRQMIDHERMPRPSLASNVQANLAWHFLFADLSNQIPDCSRTAAYKDSAQGSSKTVSEGRGVEPRWWYQTYAPLVHHLDGGPLHVNASLWIFLIFISFSLILCNEEEELQCRSSFDCRCWTSSRRRTGFPKDHTSSNRLRLRRQGMKQEP
jgi:hypothetical protein